MDGQIDGHRSRLIYAVEFSGFLNSLSLLTLAHDLVKPVSRIDLLALFLSPSLYIILIIMEVQIQHAFEN